MLYVFLLRVMELVASAFGLEHDLASELYACVMRTEYSKTMYCNFTIEKIYNILDLVPA